MINKYWYVLQINLELQETFQNNPFVPFKSKKLTRTYKKTYDKNCKVLKTHVENRKGKCEPCNHYVATRSLTLVHFEVTKHNFYKLYFTSTTVKVNSLFSSWNVHYTKPNMLEKQKQLLT